MVERKRKIKVVEEVKEIPKVTLTRFRKLGGGALYLPNRIIKPGQVFTYDKTKIPKAFMNSLEIIEDGTEFVAEKAKPSKLLFEAKEENGVHFVANTKTGKIISTAELTKAEAEAIVKNLNS